MKRIDIYLLVSVILLVVFGLLMIYEASSYMAFRDFSDKYHYLKEQLRWAMLGFGFLVFFTLFDYHRFYKLALPILCMAIILLLLVLIPGVGIHVLGARRWINMGFFVLQPAEFVKLALAIYLAAWFSIKEKGRFSAFLLLLGLVILLVMLQPDMGTAGVILFEALTLYFISGGSITALLGLFPVVLIGGYVLIKMAPYRAARLSAFFSPEDTISSSSYHVKQILIALGMGGLTGVGIGNSLQKYAYLPENTTDSIFAIIAEEFGFIGSLGLILLFMFVVWRGFLIAARAKDTYGKLLAGGIMSFLAIQMIINLGAQTVLIPLTGIPLPFISYGGSALVVDLCAIGILLNISKQGQTG